MTGKRWICRLFVVVSFMTMPSFADDFSIEEMWKIIGNGDKDREQNHLPIDGTESSDNQRREIIEMDILKDESEFEHHQQKRSSSYEALIVWHKKIWRTRDIPYAYDNVFSGEELSIIVNSMRHIEHKTCLKFRKKTSSDKQWIRFFRGFGFVFYFEKESTSYSCYSGIGRKYWKTASTDISLGKGCVHLSIVVHEILHALGFPHEQSRYDRDSYMNIYLNRVQDSMASNFHKTQYDDYNHGGTPYDIKSVMQYGKYAFTRDPRLGHTMEYKFDPNMELGHTELSDIDVEELNKVYQCDIQSGWSNWSGWSSCIKKAWGTMECSKANVRFCLSSSCPGENEYGVEEKVNLCAESQCSNPPTDGQWGLWSPYTKCSGSCGWGVQTKYRYCDNPAESNGGETCDGNYQERHLCRNRRCSSFSTAYDVDFNNGFRNWNSQHFTIRSGRGSSYNVGPTEDVSRTGKYGVLSSTVYQTGKLTSSAIAAHPNGKKCLTFYYQTNGESFPKNTLSVYTKDSANRYVNFVPISGHHGNFWRRKAITISAKQNSYEIIIEAKVASSKHEVAIDDIFLDTGECAIGLDGECKDHKTNCTMDASKGRCNSVDDVGNADTWKRYMHQQCCATCSICEDHNTKCQKWADEGYCTTNTWMLWNCCASCYQKCQSASSLCKDDPLYASKCAGWASQEECVKNRDWMGKYCYKSCYEVISQ